MSASLSPECSEKKERYDTCFIKWYSESTGPSLAESLWCDILGPDSGKLLEYLRGDSQTDECEDLFKEYKICLTKALKERGIDTMIEEARKTSPNNDNAKHGRH